MIKAFFILDFSLFIFYLAFAAANAQDSEVETTSSQQRHLLLVTGVVGTEEYREKFADWTNTWSTTGKEAGWRVTAINGDDKARTSRQQLESSLEQARDVDELWLVMIGHGTFDGDQAKFNLVGEDVSSAELGGWLAQRKKPTVIVNCASSSAPFITELAGQDRVIVTATKSGYEMSFCHFGGYLAEAISQSGIDLDKDRQTSLLEAVIVAAGKTAEFYDSDSRLATEHALIDDNGDGFGTPVEWFRGVRVIKVAKDGTPADGLAANQVFFSLSNSDSLLGNEQLKQRNDLEKQIDRLRSRKSQVTEDQYYQQLESIMLRLAKLYEAAADDAE